MVAQDTVQPLRQLHLSVKPVPLVRHLTWANVSINFTLITIDPKKLKGQPCIRGLRLTVRRVIEAVATYPDRKELQREFSEIEEADIREALAYAAAGD